VVHMFILRLKSRRTARSSHSILVLQESGPYPKRKWYVTYFLKGLWDTDREQDNYYPLPIRITPENFEVLEGECVENVTHGLPWRLMETLHAWRLGPKKRLKRPGARVGCGGRDAENGSQSRSFLPPFHRYIDTYWLVLGIF
jgi:hypothetical protein